MHHTYLSTVNCSIDLASGTDVVVLTISEQHFTDTIAKRNLKIDTYTSNISCGADWNTTDHSHIGNIGNVYS